MRRIEAYGALHTDTIIDGLEGYFQSGSATFDFITSSVEPERAEDTCCVHRQANSTMWNDLRRDISYAIPNQDTLEVNRWTPCCLSELILVIYVASESR